MPFEFALVSPYLAMALLFLVFIAFALELRSPDVIAFCGAVVALAIGLVGPNDLLAAIANPAPATIGAMFVLSAALVRTGVLEGISEVLSRYGAHRPTLTLGLFFAAAAVASAFMNNTPVVMVLIAIVITLAREMKLAPSHLLIPLSYMVILGGTCSLIGTSTNLLVDGIAQDLGMVPFTLFEIAPLGIIVAIVGGAFLALAAPRLLPVRQTAGSYQSKRDERTWLVELFIPAGSPLIGKTVLEVDAFKKGGSRAVDLVCGDLSLRDSLASSAIQAGDIVVIKTVDTEILGFRDGAAGGGSTVLGAEPSTARRTSVVEILIGPNSKSLHRMIGRLHWRRRFRVYPIALHRKGAALDIRLATARLAVGDTLLLEGAADDIASLVEEEQLIVLSPLESRPFRRTKAPIAIGTMFGVVVLAALNVAPILTLALIGVVVVLLTNCIDADEGVGSIDGRLLLLIVSMLTLGTALDNSGALSLIVSKATPLLATVQPIVALALVYALTSFLTELVTNNAVAVLVAPIAAGIAVQLGLDPRPFVVAVMFGASASFATPIGYQTNTLVYNAGGYRFTDFLKIGIPMNIIVGAVTVFIVPLIWPLSH
jgi:di/tricarboxylate transporter